MWRYYLAAAGWLRLATRARVCIRQHSGNRGGSRGGGGSGGG